MERRDFPSSALLAPAFASWTGSRLEAAIAARGAALLIVSGGRTPVRFFQALSGVALDWSRVSVTLADERRVPDDNPRSNAQLLRENLLVERAAAAHFVPLANARISPEQELAGASARIAALPLPADVVVLGMGDDGHTASWFPGADRLSEAIDPGTRELVLPITAPSAPEPRLTLTARVILRARALALHIEGDAKLETLARALADGPIESMPIRAVLRGASDRLTIFSTPTLRQQPSHAPTGA
jgi:6-phosphogluconolactonase